MSQESGSQGLFPEITLPRPSLGTLRASVSLRPTQRPILPSMVIPTVILRFILCHLSSRAFLSYNQPCSTQTDFSLTQDLTKNHSPAKKKRNSLYFSFLSKPGQRLQECLTSPKELLVTILQTPPQGSEQRR